MKRDEDFDAPALMALEAERLARDAEVRLSRGMP